MSTQRVFVSKKAGLLSVVSFVGLVLSFLIQIKLFQKFGLSNELDAYFIAWAAPSIFMGLMAMFFDSALVPQLQKIYLTNDLSFGWYRIWVLKITHYSIIIGILGLLLTFIGSFWFSGKGEEFKEIFVLSSLLNWIFFVFYSVVSLLSTLLRSKNLLYWVSLFALFPHFFMWIALHQSWTNSVIEVGIAMIAGVCFQLFMVAIVLSNASSTDKINFEAPKIGRVLKGQINTLISLLPFVVLPFIDAIWIASVEAGAYSALAFIQRIVSAVHVLIAQAIFTALLPVISTCVTQGNLHNFRIALMEGLELAIFTSIPISFFLFIFSGDILNLLLLKSGLDATQKFTFEKIMNFAAPSVIGVIVYSVLIRAIHAKQESSRIVKLTFLLLAAYLFVSKLLVTYLGGLGLAFSQSLFWISALFCGMWIVREYVYPIRLLQCGIKAFLFCLISFIATFLFLEVIMSFGDLGAVELFFSSTIFIVLSLYFDTPIKVAVSSIWLRIHQR